MFGGFDPLAHSLLEINWLSTFFTTRWIFTQLNKHIRTGKESQIDFCPLQNRSRVSENQRHIRVGIL